MQTLVKNWDKYKINIMYRNQINIPPFLKEPRFLVLRLYNLVFNLVQVPEGDGYDRSG